MSKKKEQQKEQKAPETAEKQVPESELIAMQEQYARLQAEFANYKRRTDEQLVSSVELGVGKTLKAIINVLDDFTLALQNKESKDFAKGIEMIYAKFMSTGEDLGLKRIATVGKQFDPTRHEALLAEESDKPEQEVIEELQAGYEFNGTTLRTAKVKVAK
jgi:molecular chaperone GrpE